MLNFISQLSKKLIYDTIKETSTELVFALPTLIGLNLIKNTSWKFKTSVVTIIVIPRMLFTVTNLALRITSEREIPSKRIESKENTSAIITTETENIEKDYKDRTTTFAPNKTLKEILNESIGQNRELTIDE